MSHGISEIHIRRQRGKVTVQAKAMTPRLQRYIKQSVAISATTMHAPEFKNEMAAVVEEMMAQDLVPR